MTESFVQYRSHGFPSSVEYPDPTEDNRPAIDMRSNGTCTAFMALHGLGDLLILLCSSTQIGFFTPPPGWNTIGPWTFDNAEVKTYYDTVSGNAETMPNHWPSEQVVVYWKIADEDDDVSRFDPWYIWTGLQYESTHNPDSDFHTAAAGMLAFSCLETDTFVQLPWADVPLKAEFTAGPDTEWVDANETSVPVTPHEVTLVAPVADAPGNHLWVTDAVFHGSATWEQIVDEDDLTASNPYAFDGESVFIWPASGDFANLGQDGAAYWEGSNHFISSTGTSIDDGGPTDADTIDLGVIRIYANIAIFSDGEYAAPGRPTYAILPALAGLVLLIQAGPVLGGAYWGIDVRAM